MTITFSAALIGAASLLHLLMAKWLDRDVYKLLRPINIFALLASLIAVLLSTYVD